MKNPPTVFICSTSSDLSTERDAVLEVIRKVQLQHNSMELFGARSSLPIETCLEEVRRSDLLIVIVGYKYGTLVPNKAISFSEAEYSEGDRLGKLCLVYLRDEKIPILPIHFECVPQKIRALKSFKERLKERHTVKTFKDANDLAVNVALDLNRAVQSFKEAHPLLDVSSSDTIKEKGAAFQTEYYTQMIATQGDPTVSPEIYSGILTKLEQDFKLGALDTPKIFQLIHKQAETHLAPLSGFTDTGRFISLDLSAISDDSWWGVQPNPSIKILRNTVQKLGRPIRVSCSSINVAAYAVLKGFLQREIPIEVFPNNASGREQVITLADAGPIFDFVVCADAPMFLDRNHNVKLYIKIFEVYREEQFLLRKRGNHRANRPTVLVYQASSAEQQFLLACANRDKFPLSEKFKDEPLLHMVDFTRVSEFMKPGDMVFAWGALVQSLMSNQSLVKVKGSDFALTVSMFCHPDWFGRTKELNAFFDLFVAEWRFWRGFGSVFTSVYGKGGVRFFGILRQVAALFKNRSRVYEKLAAERLINDAPFMESFARGGGFKTLFRNDH